VCTSSQEFVRAGLIAGRRDSAEEGLWQLGQQRQPGEQQERWGREGGTMVGGEEALLLPSTPRELGSPGGGVQQPLCSTTATLVHRL
jgi:hypothetical protein